MDGLTFKLHDFEGPMDLLLYLIHKNKMNIYDIPISYLADQFVEYMDRMGLKSMEEMSHFLVMAATLLEIKSKMLLPKPQPEEELEEDPREQLTEKVKMYQFFKYLAEFLKEKEQEGTKVYFKAQDYCVDELKSTKQEHAISECLKDVTLNNLFLVFQSVIERKELKIDRVRGDFKSIKKDTYTIEEKMEAIMELLAKNATFLFSHIFEKDDSRIELVVSFLALLELIKSNRVNITQHDTFDEIYISLIG